MKIAYIFSEFPSGQVSNSTRVFSMLERGHDVTVFANTKGNSAFYRDELKKYSARLNCIYINNSLFESIKILINDIFKNPILCLKNIVKASNKNIFYQNYTKRVIGGKGGKSNLLVTKKKTKILTYYFRIKAFQNKEFDIIVSFFGTIGNNYLFLKNLYPTVPYVTYFVGFDYSSYVYSTAKINLYSDLFNKADLIFAKSSFSKQTLIALGANEEKVKIDYNGINLDKFECRDFNKRIGKVVKFIIVSRLEKKKCHILILKALNKILEKHINFTFTIVGDGPERKNLEEYLNVNLQLKEKVLFLGLKSQQEIKQLLRNYHIFIHPSSSSLLSGSMEDTPTAILEAMACGLPIISTYHAGIPDLVLNNYNGRLVPERNLDLLISVIESFMLNQECINTYGRNSRKLTEERFDSDLNAHKNEILYNSIIQENDKKNKVLR